MVERLEKPPSDLPQSAQSEETHKTADPRAHLEVLDGLRGVAVLVVVMTHISAVWTLDTGIHPHIPLWQVDMAEFIRFYGELQIPLFFLLSGYLLAWTEEKRARRGSYSFLSYAKRRALRIVPAYYVAIAVVILTWPIVLPELWRVNLVENPDLGFASFGGVLAHLTFLHGFKPLAPSSLDPAWWSLTPEIVFYAMLPLLVLRFRKLSQRVVILVLLLLVSLATRVLAMYDVFRLLPLFSNNFQGQERMWFFPTTLLYIFLVGMLLKTLFERYADVGHQPGFRQLSVASALSVVSVALLLAFPYLGMNFEHILHHPVGMIAEATALLAVASALLGSPILKPVLKWRPLVFLGEISYSLFLLHMTALFTMDHYIWPTFGTWLPNQGRLMVLAAFSVCSFSVLAAAVPIAYLSYRYIESPFLRRKPKK